MRTPRTLSPFMLIQEFLRDEPWKLLCAVIMLNQTSARQVWRMLPTFFERYPTPGSLCSAPDAEIKELIAPLGFKNRRCDTLKKMSADYLASVSPLIPERLYGIGKYGADSYKMFCEGYLIKDVRDKELKNYVRWAEERYQGCDGAQRGDPGSG